MVRLKLAWEHMVAVVPAVTPGSGFYVGSRTWVCRLIRFSLKEVVPPPVLPPLIAWFPVSPVRRTPADLP